MAASEQIAPKTKLINEGVKHMLLAIFFFALMNVAVKKVSHIPAMEVVFFRCFTATCIALFLIKRRKLDWLGSNRKLLLLRGTFGTIALYLFFLSIQKMPLASAMTIQYLSPIFTTIVAVFLLDEIVLPVQWIFFAMSFAGVLMIKGFDTRVSVFYLIVGITSAFFSALAYNMVRSLKEKEHHLVVVLHFQIIGAVAGFVFSVFNWAMPQRWDWLWLILTGVLAHLGQVSLTKSFHAEKVSNVSILSYSGILYGLLFGYFMFGELYSLLTLFGILLVIGGVVLSLIYQRRKASIAL